MLNRLALGLCILSVMLLGGKYPFFYGWLLTLGCGWTTFYIFTKGIPKNLKKQAWLLMAFILYTTLTSFWFSWDWLMTWASLSCLFSCGGFYLAGAHFNHKGKTKIMIRFFLILSLLTFLAFSGTFVGGDRLFLLIPHKFSLPPYGFLPNNNLFGSFLLLILSLGFYCLSQRYKRSKDWKSGKNAWLIVLLFLIIIIFGLTKSWGAWVALVITCWLYLFLRFSWKGRWVLSMGLLAVFIFSYFNLPQAKYLSLRARYHFYISGLSLMTRNPITGSGLGTFSLIGPTHQPPLAGQIMDKAHNDFLELGVTTGLLGLPLWILMVGLAYSLLKIFREGKPKSILAGGVLAVAIHGWVDFPFSVLTISWLGSFLAGFTLQRHHGKGKTFVLKPFVFSVGVLFTLFSLTLGLAHASKGRYFGFFAPKVVMENLKEARKQDPANQVLTLALITDSLHPHYAPLKGELSRTFQALNLSDFAWGALWEALKLQPYNVQLLLIASKYQYLQGHRQEAIAYLTRAKALKPSLPVTLIPLSSDERDRVIVESIHEAIVLFPWNRWRLYLIGINQLNQFQSPKAWELIEEAMKALPQDPLFFIKAGDFWSSRDPQKALTYFQRSIAIKKDPFVLLKMASILYKLGKIHEGRQYFEEALKLSEYHPKVVIYAYQFYPDNIEKQYTLYQQSFASFPSADVAHRLGNYWEHKGELAEAFQWYKKALGLGEQSGWLYHKCYQLAEKLQRWGEAKQLQEEALKTLPKEDYLRYFSP